MSKHKQSFAFGIMTKLRAVLRSAKKPMLSDKAGSKVIDACMFYVRWLLSRPTAKVISRTKWQKIRLRLADSV